MHAEFPAVAFIAALSLLLPLPWHWRARNIATLFIIFWLFFLNIILGVDAIVWGDNVDVTIPVWCDITSSFIVGANMALPAACLCICIHLERVASFRQTSITYEDRRRRQIFEFCMCFILPLVFIALHVIVQGHRYDIIEGYGCRPATYFSIPSIFIVHLPPILMGTLCLVYAVLSIIHFMRHRLIFAQHLGNSGSALTTSRYLRLVVMALVEMVWCLFLTSYVLWFAVKNERLQPWTSWADVHALFWRVGKYPAALIPPALERSYYTIWWLVPISSFIFIGFFAFGKEALDEYISFGKSVKRLFARLTHREPYGDSIEDEAPPPPPKSPFPESKLSLMSNTTTTSSEAFDSFKVDVENFAFEISMGSESSFTGLSPSTMSFDEKYYQPPPFDVPSDISFVPSDIETLPVPLTPPPRRRAFDD